MSGTYIIKANGNKGTKAVMYVVVFVSKVTIASLLKFLMWIDIKWPIKYTEMHIGLHMLSTQISVTLKAYYASAFNFIDIYCPCIFLDSINM